jgi:hypothetical protein
LFASIICEKDVRIERYNPVDPIQYVVSENLKRRHLTSQQRAAIAVEAVELYELLRQQAKERQGERTDLKQETDIPQKIGECEEPPTPKHEKETATRIARSVNTNPEYFRKAQKVKQHAPEKLEEVKSGKTDLNDAFKVAKEREKEVKGAMMESGKPETIVYPLVLG